MARRADTLTHTPLRMTSPARLAVEFSSSGRWVYGGNAADVTYADYNFYGATNRATPLFYRVLIQNP